MKNITLLLLLTVSLACSASSDEPELFTETTRDYPDGGVEVEIGEVQQAITAGGFMGWRGDTGGLGRAALCSDPASAGQICYLPQSKSVRWYVDPVGFTQANVDQLNSGLAVHKSFWTQFYDIGSLTGGGPAGSGWTLAAGSSASHNVQIKSGSVVALYPAGDSRHWIQVGCATSTTLTENPSLTGTYKRCDRVVVTIDLSKIGDDGASAGTINSRLKQTAGQAIGFGVGKGLSNIDGGQVFSLTAAGASNLGYIMNNRDWCNMDLYNQNNNTSITKLPSTSCDGWNW